MSGLTQPSLAVSQSDNPFEMASSVFCTQTNQQQKSVIQKVYVKKSRVVSG